MAVFVLDRRGKPLMPCSEKRARLLLERGRARVPRVVPMVIRLADRQVANCKLQPVRVKVDPGSKTTGFALVRDRESTDSVTGEIYRQVAVLNLMELVHRGHQISEALTARRNMRRRRRSNYAARVRDRKRHTYNQFLLWCERHPELPAFDFPEDKATWFPRIMDNFPEFEQKYKKSCADLAEQQAMKEKFNGAFVSQLTGLKGKELGFLLKGFKESFASEDALRDYVLNTSLTDIEVRVRRVQVEMAS